VISALARQEEAESVLMLFLRFCLAGGLLTWFASTVSWYMLGTLVWMPYWRQLRDHGMNADDNGWAMGTVLVPPFVGVAFVVTTLISLIAARRFGHPRLFSIVLNLIPGLFWTWGGVKNVLYGQYWEYPGFEFTLLLIGFGWGAALYSLAGRSGYVES
jgi:hypothetical protein